MFWTIGYRLFMSTLLYHCFLTSLSKLVTLCYPISTSPSGWSDLWSPTRTPEEPSPREQGSLRSVQKCSTTISLHTSTSTLQTPGNHHITATTCTMSNHIPSHRSCNTLKEKSNRTAAAGPGRRIWCRLSQMRTFFFLAIPFLSWATSME